MDKHINFSTQAFSKMVMHAMKYPHCYCSGFLLSHKEDKDVNGDGVRKVYISDAIPVSHSSHSLAPLVEIAFNSISQYAQEQGLVISGFYQADRFNESAVTDVFSQRIADKIYESFSDAVLCYLSFEETISKSILDLHQFSDGKWRRKGVDFFELEQDIQKLSDHILFSKENLHRSIVDFDEHFNNLKLDWTNSSVSERIDKIMTDVC